MKGLRLRLSDLKQQLVNHVEMVAAIISGIITLVAWSMEDQTIAISLYVVSYLVGSYAKTKEGIISLVKDKEIDVNLLMFVAAVGAASINFWFEGAMLIFIFSLSGALETYALARSERDISALVHMNPDNARVRGVDGEESCVPIAEIKVGDLVIIRPGEVVPVDAVVLRGESCVNQANITGESVPVDVSADSEVFAGTQNGAGSLEVRVIRSNEETVFSKIIELLENSKDRLPKSQQGIKKIEKIYIKCVLLFTGVLFSGLYFGFSWSFTDSLYRTMIFLVVSSPCALVASIMPAILASLANAAKLGILFKNGGDIETLAHASLIVFDKTGTLTTGKPEVKDIVLLGEKSEQEVLEIAGAIESVSTHPLAQSIVVEAAKKGVTFNPPDKVNEEFGYGVTGEYKGKYWKIGKPTFFSALSSKELPTDQIKAFEEQGKTVVLLGDDEQVVAIISMQDKVRDDARDVVAQIHSCSLGVAMLTGDHPTMANVIGDNLGISDIHSELLPEDKVNYIIKMRERKNVVTMVGDGINDAPALAHADIGVALGKTSNNITVQNADVILMNDDLKKLNIALKIAKKTSTVIKQNITFSLSVIALLMGLNFCQSISLPWSVVCHEGSTILVILNGLRLLMFKGSKVEVKSDILKSERGLGASS